MKKLLTITYDFPPRRTSGTYRITNCTKYLIQLGWQPTVVTIQRRKGDVEDPELFDKIPQIPIVRTRYWQLQTLEDRAWSEVRARGALKSPPDKGSQPLLDVWLRAFGRFVRSCVYFPDPSVGWVPFGFAKAAALHRKEHFAAIYTSDPPRASSVIGFLLKLSFRVPWVLEFRDPWYRPATALRRRFEAWLQGAMLRLADSVIVVTKGHAKELQERFKLPAKKLFVIPNGFDEQDFSCSPKEASSALAPGYLQLTHLGTVYPNFSGNFFPALLELLRERPELRDKLRVNIIGYPDETVRRYAAENELRKVVSLSGLVQHAEAIRLMRSSDALLVFLGNPDFSRLAVSSKVYEYLRSGRPILALAYPGGIQELLEEAHAGWVVSPDDVAAIRRALDDLLRGLQGNGVLPVAPPDFVRQFAWDQLARRMSSILDGVARSTR